MGWGEVALMIPWQPAGGITSRGQREKVTMENCAPRVVLLDACLSLGPLRPTVFRVFGCPSLGLAFSQPHPPRWLAPCILLYIDGRRHVANYFLIQL